MPTPNSQLRGPPSIFSYTTSPPTIVNKTVLVRELESSGRDGCPLPSHFLLLPFQPNNTPFQPSLLPVDLSNDVARRVKPRAAEPVGAYIDIET